MASKLYGYLLIVTFILCFEAVFPTVYLPVVLWDSSKAQDNIPALQRLGKDEFRGIIEKKLNNNPYVIIFAEENLSTEDLSSNDAFGSSVFDPLVKATHGDSVKYFPAVQSPIRVLQDISTKENLVKATLTRSGFSIEPKPEAGHFYLLDLDDSENDEDRLQLLEKHVKFMADLYKKLFNKYDNVLAIYTAHHPSWYVPSLTPINRNTRQLLEVDEDVDRTTIYNSSDILYYLNDIPVLTYVENGTSRQHNLSDLKYDSKQEENSITLTVVNENITFVMNFITYNGYWYFENILIDPSNVLGIPSVNLTNKEVYAPTSFSYHCQSLVLEKSNVILVLPGLQVQPNFNRTKEIKQFGDAYDCVGFTSVPIWSGLFVTFILALIMTLGLSMMMDIKTMDRFDDPKGKTITVNVTE